MRLNAAVAALIGFAMVAAAVTIIATHALAPALARLGAADSAQPRQAALPAWRDAEARLYRQSLSPRD